VVLLITLLVFQPPDWVRLSRTPRRAVAAATEAAAADQHLGRTAAADPGRRLGRTAAADPRRRLGRTAAADPARHQVISSVVVSPAADQDRHQVSTAVDRAQHQVSSVVVSPAAGLGRERVRTAVGLGRQRVSPVGPAASHLDHTPPERRPPRCAETSVGQVDPIVRQADSIGRQVDLIARRVDPVLDLMRTSGVRELPQPTSAGTSADRVGPTPISVEASTGLVQQLGSSGRASAVRGRRPSRRGVAPAETSAFNCED
jgi:hypothetical protein